MCFLCCYLCFINFKLSESHVCFLCCYLCFIILKWSESHMCFLCCYLCITNLKWSGWHLCFLCCYLCFINLKWFSLNIFYLLKYAKRIRHKLNKLMKFSPTYNKLQHYLIEQACIWIFLTLICVNWRRTENEERN